MAEEFKLSNESRKIDRSGSWSIFCLSFMSSISVGIQKLAIHSQLIGLKAALKISNIVSK